jgi:hypothetical protein
MEKDISLVFHNEGLRSYIEVDLCAECPRQDGKGCCGYYSPVFYPTDLAYLYINQPALIDYVFNLGNLTVLDASVTINNDIDGESYRCKFHSKDGGCILTQLQRETICRHFVCPGIDWQREPNLQHWNLFFKRLFDYEIELNNRITNELVAQGLTLRNPSLREKFKAELLRLFDIELQHLPDFLNERPPVETFNISRIINRGHNWPL